MMRAAARHTFMAPYFGVASEMLVDVCVENACYCEDVDRGSGLRLTIGVSAKG